MAQGSTLVEIVDYNLDLVLNSICNMVLDFRSTVPDLFVDGYIYTQSTTAIAGLTQRFNGRWNRYVHDHFTGDINGVLNFTRNFTVVNNELIENLNAQLLQNWTPSLTPTVDPPANTIAMRNQDGQMSAADPTLDHHVATQAYVKRVAVGAQNLVREPVRVATNTDLGLVRDGNNVSLPNVGDINDTGIDGITDLDVGDHVLVIHENSGGTVNSTTGTTSITNGIYVITNLGSQTENFAMTRRTIGGVINYAHGLRVVVKEGGTNRYTEWLLNTDGTIVVGTTPLQFVFITGQPDIGSYLNLDSQPDSTGVKQGGIVNQNDELRVGTGNDTSAQILKGYHQIIPGDGTTKVFTITHNMNTTRVRGFINQVSAPYNPVRADVDPVDNNNIVLTFSNVVPAGNELEIFLMGL